MIRIKPLKLVLVTIVFLITGTLVSGCGCLLKRIVDQGVVTVRGLAVKSEVDAKANEGYDVREARAKWSLALQAYGEGDFETANLLLDQTTEALANVEKVAERVYYPSSGGITVSGLLFKPPGEGPWPTIIVNHAGLGTAGDFSDVALGIRDRGYLVFNPDYRGSGESEGQHELAKGEVDDVLYAIKYLRERGLVEGDRIGMYGQSHGAAVALLAAERDPSVKAVVAEAGFCDAAGIYENALSRSDDPVIKYNMDQFLPIIGGTPEERPEEYRVRSAIYGAERMQAAVLLIHGEQDTLIPVEQAYRMYDALQRAGKTVELKIYPDEGHTVVLPQNRAEVWDLMFEWFARYI